MQTCLSCGGDGWIFFVVHSSSSVVRASHHQGCGGSMLCASWENVNSADPLMLRDIWVYHPSFGQGQPPPTARQCLAYALNSRCPLLKHSLWSVLAQGAWDGVLCCLEAVFYLQFLPCLFFKHFLQLLQNKVLFFTKLLFKCVWVGLGTSEEVY